LPLRTLTLASLSSLLIVLAALPLRAETVTLTTGPDDPPYTDRDRADGGSATRLVMAVFQAMGVQAKLEWLPWRRGYSLTKSGTYQASFPYLKTADRERDFMFSDVLYSADSYIWTRTGETLVAEDPAGFRNRTLCVPQGYHSPLLEVLASMIERGETRLERAESPEKCVQMLGAGRVDALTGPEATITLYTETNGLSGKITHGAAPIRQLDFHAVFSKESGGNRQLVERFNRTLRKMKEDGSYAEVMSHR
jgi:polar amino acid transport system substrate-binding protein